MVPQVERFQAAGLGLTLALNVAVAVAGWRPWPPARHSIRLVPRHGGFVQFLPGCGSPAQLMLGPTLYQHSAPYLYFVRVVITHVNPFPSTNHPCFPGDRDRSGTRPGSDSRHAMLGRYLAGGLSFRCCQLSSRLPLAGPRA